MIPRVENDKSYIAYPSTPLIDIAVKTRIEAAHFRYQSKVYLGVTDFTNFDLLILNSLARIVSFQ